MTEDFGLIPALARAIVNPELADLTPRAAERFNLEVPDRAGLRYRSYAACRPAGEMPLVLRGWAERLQQESGDNDSQVAVG